MIAVADGGQRVTRKTVYEARTALGRLGAPFGQYLQDDVAAGRVGAKLLVFLSPWRMDAAQRRQLLVAGRGRAKVWCYAPGYLDGARTNLAAMRELSGFDLRPVNVPQAMATPTAAGEAIGLAPLGLDEAVAPLFAATDATEAESARWSTARPHRRAADAGRLTPFVGTRACPPRCSSAGRPRGVTRSADRLQRLRVLSERGGPRRGGRTGGPQLGGAGPV